MLEPENIKYLVVHCADSANDEDIGCREIHAMHLGFGWHGVGYHRVIRRVIAGLARMCTVLTSKAWECV